jgi:hypothetical protein
MHVSLHVKYPSFVSDIHENWIFWTDFRKILKFKISLKFVRDGGGPSCPIRADRRTDKQADMAKIIVAFQICDRA